MSYRLVKLTSHYPKYLEDFQQRCPPDPAASYESAAERLHADGFAWADFYARNLRARGVDAHEIVGNAEWLQAAWAREHDATELGSALVLRQLEHLRPDVLFVQDIYRYDAAFIAEARGRIPSLRVVLGWCCAPYGEAASASLRTCDAALTCTPGFVQDFRAGGINAFRLNHAFETSLLSRVSSSDGPADSDVLFSGTFVQGEQGHGGRGDLVERLLRDGFDLRLFGHLVEERPARTRLKQAAWLAAQVLTVAGLEAAVDRYSPLARTRSWRRMPVVARFPDAVRGAIRPALYGLSMYKALRTARVGLNVHGDVTPRYAGNMRLFECTGIGTCLLTDWKENLSELFEPDVEVAAYRSVDECAEKLAWLLSNDEARAGIAAAGQRRVLASHTFAHRAAEIDDLVQNHL